LIGKVGFALGPFKLRKKLMPAGFLQAGVHDPQYRVLRTVRQNISDVT
jgi:hypothetical protein